MSSLTLPNWPAAPLVDQTAFRSWLKSATNPGGPGFGPSAQRLHRVIAPLAIQAELGRGCNAMLLDALAAGPDHLPERMGVASERILDCLEFATDAERGLIGDLSHRLITPIDSEDLVHLSRHFTCGIERLASVATTAAMVSLAEPALQPIHAAIAESLAVCTSALTHLGDRDHGLTSYLQLHQQYRKAKSFSRQYFNHLLSQAGSVHRSFAIVAVQSGYSELIAHLGQTAGLLYRTTLKNG